MKTHSRNCEERFEWEHEGRSGASWFSHDTETEDNWFIEADSDESTWVTCRAS